MTKPTLDFFSLAKRLKTHLGALDSIIFRSRNTETQQQPFHESEAGIPKKELTYTVGNDCRWFCYISEFHNRCSDVQYLFFPHLLPASKPRSRSASPWKANFGSAVADVPMSKWNLDMAPGWPCFPPALKKRAENIANLAPFTMVHQLYSMGHAFSFQKWVQSSNRNRENPEVI